MVIRQFSYNISYNPFKLVLLFCILKLWLNIPYLGFIAISVEARLLFGQTDNYFLISLKQYRLPAMNH